MGETEFMSSQAANFHFNKKKIFYNIVLWSYVLNEYSKFKETFYSETELWSLEIFT